MFKVTLVILLSMLFQHSFSQNSNSVRGIIISADTLFSKELNPFQYYYQGDSISFEYLEKDSVIRFKLGIIDKVDLFDVVKSENNKEGLRLIINLKTNDYRLKLSTMNYYGYNYEMIFKGRSVYINCIDNNEKVDVLTIKVNEF